MAKNETKIGRGCVRTEWKELGELIHPCSWTMGTQSPLEEVKDISAAWIRDLTRHQRDLRFERWVLRWGEPLCKEDP
jgi:hypothetical protein